MNKCICGAKQTKSDTIVNRVGGHQVMDNTEDNEQRHVKLAPIFDLKNNKVGDNAAEPKSKKRKRKKSPKNEQKSIKKYDLISVENVNESKSNHRRSLRLKDKVEKEEISYKEDTDEESRDQIRNEDIENKLNQSVVLLEEDSNTVDYWDTTKTEDNSTIVDTDDDIEVIGSIDAPQCPISSQELSVNRSLQCVNSREYLLWTEKYKPSKSCEIIGHKVAVNQLKSWLEDWGKSESNKESFGSEDGSEQCLDETNTCLLICGPTGSGKTSMVYAVAEELKYEVFELNASIKRNGRTVSKVLSEATQSHHMLKNHEPNTSTPSIHSFFKSVSNNPNIEANNVEIGRKKSKKKQKPNGIMNYFQRHDSEKSCPNIGLNQISVNKAESKVEIENVSVSKTTEEPVIVPKVLSIASRSLILFDDIDVLIDEDSNGFWGAVNKIVETTKKPVIMTATQFVPYISDSVNRLQVLTLHKPNSSDTIDALKTIYDKESEQCETNMNETNDKIFNFLSNSFDNDIRRCINQLQFGVNRDDTDTFGAQPEEFNDNKLNSYYNSLLYDDLMKTRFGISSDLEIRNNWMQSKVNPIEDGSHSIDLAEDILETVTDLNRKLHISYNFKNSFPIDFNLPIDSQSTESISRFISPNTALRTIVMDYCPYLSLICESETQRQTQLANHSRRSRRFMHHLDSVGIYIDNIVKTKLISAFALKNSENINDFRNESSTPKKDDYFYE